MGVRTPTLEELAAKQAITEVLYRYARSMDRMDLDLARTCWHPEGTDSHSPLYSGSYDGFIEWVWRVHAGMIATRHVVTNILIQLDLPAERAGAECYWTVTMRIPHQGGVADICCGGRYLDRLECRNGEWAILHRESVMDMVRVEPLIHDIDVIDPAIFGKADQADVTITPSRRDREDFSYTVVPNL